MRTLVITSAVPEFLAAGADIKHMASIDAECFAAYGDRLRAVLDRLAGSGRTTIAAVEGRALGGGMEPAMACTLRVAGADALFGLPEVKLGLVPGAGGTQRLPRLVGRGRAGDHAHRTGGAGGRGGVTSYAAACELENRGRALLTRRDAET